MTENFYSISGFSTKEFEIEHPPIFIAPGMNAFNCVTSDIKSLITLLEEKGLRVDEVNKLDGTATHTRD